MKEYWVVGSFSFFLVRLLLLKKRECLLFCVRLELRLSVFIYSCELDDYHDGKDIKEKNRTVDLA